MFKVVVKKHIHSCFAAVSSEDKWVIHQLVLPFAPTVGLTLREGEWEATLLEVYYDCAERMFLAYTDSDKELYNAGLAKLKGETRVTPSLQEIVQSYIDTGWSLEVR